VSFDATAQVGSVADDIGFSTDGTKMFILEQDSGLFQYTLSTAFDVSTASYDSISLDVTQQSTDFNKFKFSPDGSKLFFANEVFGGESKVYQYTLSVTFDLSTASFDNVTFDVDPQITFLESIAFNNNGTKMFASDSSSQSVFQYTLTNPYDISSVSYDNKSHNVNMNPVNFTFNSDGTKMAVLGASDNIIEFTLSTGFDISTASFNNVSYDLSSDGINPQSHSFSTDGTKMFVLDRNPSTIEQYTTGEFDSQNKMTSTQLNAASDADQISLNDDLDLAITMKYISTNANRPTSDGVSINYDGNVATTLAVPGTDYTYTVVNNDTVVLESLTDQNLKLRIL
jgi:sugar lactone lactonase YvrE